MKEPRVSRANASLYVVAIRRERNAAMAAQRILEAISAPLLVENTEIYLTASIGIADVPD